MTFTMQVSRSSAGWARRVSPLLRLDPIEQVLAARASGVLWLLGSVAFATFPMIPGVVHDDLGAIYGLSGFGLVWGLINLRLNPRELGPVYMHFSSVAACATVGGAVAATGGTRSGAWPLLFWVVLFACYFYRPPVGAFYIVACSITQALPLIYEPHALDNGYLSILIVGVAGYSALGIWVMLGKRIIDRARLRAQALAAEEAALQRTATAVLRGEQAEDVYQRVSQEVANALGRPAAGLYQLAGEGELTAVASWSDGTTGVEQVGERVKVRPGGPFEAALEADAAVIMNRLPLISPGYRLGFRAVLTAPVRVEGENWGVISVASADPDSFQRADKEYVTVFADLVAHIVGSLEDRAKLATEALTDQLTGLANHRALHQRLESETHGAERHGRVLSVAMLDIDNFKEINDVGGHASGDAALTKVADCLRAVVRSEDTIGRLGGDEFMWIMPDTDSHEAWMAVERARDLIAAIPLTPRRATASAGVSDTTHTYDSAELTREADVALYSSKAAGRNLATIYDVEEAVGARTRAEWFERSQAMSGLRALARAIDAKDPATREHSERVADLAARLAKALGWAPRQVAKLREAALVHDVGKLGIPDSLLTKPGALTDAEREQMNEHAELSARIVGSALGDEQVSWILAHHERPDGAGYPHGLGAEQIPEGAALIALADAWDVMVVGRPYNSPKTPEEAYAECLSLADAQFSRRAVDALRVLRETRDTAFWRPGQGADEVRVTGVAPITS